jgi:predicted alpha/beta hydrolase family esterase
MPSPSTRESTSELRPSTLRDRPGGEGRPILIVPGLYDSEPGHWQDIWLRTVAGAQKVDQAIWDRPTLAEWVAELVVAVRRSPGAVLVGHSLGCALIAHVAQLRGARGIAGALLVAPAEVNRGGPAGNLLSGFGPMPMAPLPFPSVVVASRDDPYVKFESSRQFADSWRATFVDAGAAGHINVASGYGDWPAGNDVLQDLLNRIDAEHPTPSVVGGTPPR